jgi:predicted regulator of Ras-like GTPase activity (Roadblock/LC7/MglB family)
MAKINLDRGLYDWAEAEIRKSMEIEGSTRATELLLAEVQIYRGEFDAATRLLKRLHQTDPANQHIKKLLDIARKLPAERSRLATAPQSSATPAPLTAPDSVAQKMTAKAILEVAMSIPHVTGGLFANNDGLVSESEWSLTLDPVVCSATFTEIHHFLTQELVKGSFGRVQTLLIETGDPVFYLVRVSRGMFIFQGTSGVNLGTLRMRISTLIEKYDESR